MAFRVLSTTILLVSLAAFPAPSQELPQRSEDFVPLGVYLSGDAVLNVLWQNLPPSEQWAKIDAMLDDMAAHHINTVWLVNETRDFMKEFARHAEARGIYLVANPPDISVRSNMGLTQSQWESRIQNLLTAWGDAPKPVAWGIYDEPTAYEREDLANCVAAFKSVAPGEPCTVVTFGHFHTGALDDIGLGFLCADLYLFFPDFTAQSSTDFWLYESEYAISQVADDETQPWLMGQAFQEAVYTDKVSFDTEGNLVYGPGSAQTWRYPTAAETRWQVWTAFFQGSTGFFHFIYTYPFLGTGNPDGIHRTFDTTWNSEAPTGLVYYPSLEPTDQYLAMAEAYGKLESIGGIWPNLERIDSGETPLSIANDSGIGALQGCFRHTSSGQEYAMAVAGFDRSVATDLVFETGPDIDALRDVSTGTYLPVRNGAVALSLEPGQGGLWEVIPYKDTDGDGLTDWREEVLGTSPSEGDTDGDGASDGFELSIGMNPLDASEYPTLSSLRVPFFN